MASLYNTCHVFSVFILLHEKSEGVTQRRRGKAAVLAKKTQQNFERNEETRKHSRRSHLPSQKYTPSFFLFMISVAVFWLFFMLSVSEEGFVRFGGASASRCCFGTCVGSQRAGDISPNKKGNFNSERPKIKRGMKW